MRYDAYVLMNPGPVVVDPRVRSALAEPDMCHREPEFAELMTRVRRKITQVCGAGETHTTVMFTGSGTAALEAAVSSAVPDGGKLLVLDNGHYAERMADVASIHGIPVERLDHGWAAPLDLVRLERALAEDASISHVGLIHHETSTGMLNPIHEVGEIVARHGRSVILDAISSLGGELLDVVADHVDWCIGTANKCLEGTPGVSFVTAPVSAVKALAGRPRRTLYLDVHSQYVAQEERRAPAFTPAIQTFMALEAALDLALEETVPGRTRRYRALAERLRAGLEALGLRLLLPPEQRCGTLTAIYLPGGMSYAELHDRLKERGFVIYAGQESLANSAFRLANMGQMAAADIDRFLAALEEVLRIG
jgi:2-aminoethylphosphonate-pyruvate transaminase